MYFSKILSQALFFSFFFNNFSHSSGFNSYVLANNFQIYTSSPYSFHNLHVEFSPGSRTSISTWTSCSHFELYMCKTQPIFLTSNLLLPLHFQTKLIEPWPLSQPVYKSSPSLMLSPVHSNKLLILLILLPHSHIPTTLPEWSPSSPCLHYCSSL